MRGRFWTLEMTDSGKLPRLSPLLAGGHVMLSEAVPGRPPNPETGWIDAMWAQ